MAHKITGTLQEVKKSDKAPKKSFKKTFYFPELGKSVEAESIQDAEKIAKK